MPTLVHKNALSWSDILLVPQYSDIKSRLDTDLTTRLTKNISLAMPICSTNMMTVTEFEMMTVMNKMGGCGFHHRFLPIGRIEVAMIKARDAGISPRVISVGVKEQDRNVLRTLQEDDLLPDAVLIDIAHGDTISVVEMIQFVKGFGVDVIAGNIATRSAAQRLCAAGADAIRCGIGGGSVCSTRTVTGHGVPTLQSVIDCYEVAKDYDVPIIADGGFKTSGDIVKALAFGADTVSLGGLLGATSASPGDVYLQSSYGYEPIPSKAHVEEIPIHNLFKKMFGMASKEAQELRGDGLKAGTAAEGISHYIQYLGDTEDIVSELIGGIRSGLTYSGARNIAELRTNSEYIILQPGGIRESKMA